METVIECPVEVGVASLPLQSRVESGDAHLVQPGLGSVLLAVIDGIGHGPEASRAATTAVNVLRDHAGEPLGHIVRQCHDALRGFRGAVMTIARLAIDGELSWLGVGNVRAVIDRADPLRRRATDELLLRGGIVGGRLPPLRVAQTRLQPADTLVLATDGVAPEFIRGLPRGSAPATLASQVLQTYGGEGDDALSWWHSTGGRRD